MKKTYSLLALLVTITLFAQTPQKMSYQAVIRNASNALVTNTTIGMRISILQDVATGPAVYVETHTASTNANGLVSLEIGGGTTVAGDFFGIDWGNNIFYLKTETDITGGTNYTIVGTSQMLSVPYALYAESSRIPTLQEVVAAGSTVTNTITSPALNTITLSSIGGTATNANYRGLSSTITGTNGFPRGLQGFSNGVNPQRNYGVFGSATNATELNVGLYGTATATAGDNYAVFGIGSFAENGKDNRGVMGYATTATVTGWNYGVSAWTGGSEVANIALGGYADAADSTNGDNYGVSARATATSTNGTNYGVYSEAANGASNYAGFFNGDVTITGTLVQPSDRKLKKDIHSFGAALAKIKDLEPVTYFYDAENTKGLNLPKNLQFGFIAQDLEKVFPNLVTKQVLNIGKTGTGGKNKTIIDANGEFIGQEATNAANNQQNSTDKEEFKGINYTGLITILTQGIKEQQTEIEDLKAKNLALEKRIQALEQLLLKK